MIKKIKKKDRIELEKRFLSSVLAMADDGDIREEIARYRLITWRRFIDKRHRIIWRALQMLDLKSVDERTSILLDEAGGEEIGEEGSAMRKQLLERLQRYSRGAAWFERELEAAGALISCGGKKYLREIAEAWAVSFNAGDIARQLEIILGEKYVRRN